MNFIGVMRKAAIVTTAVVITLSVTGCVVYTTCDYQCYKQHQAEQVEQTQRAPRGYINGTDPRFSSGQLDNPYCPYQRRPDPKCRFCPTNKH